MTAVARQLTGSARRHSEEARAAADSPEVLVAQVTYLLADALDDVCDALTVLNAALYEGPGS